MGIFNGKDKNGNQRIQMRHYSGLPGMGANVPIYLILDIDSKKLIIQKAFTKDKAETSLAFEKITGIGIVTEEVVKEANGVGRAIAGGILFGGAGAVVGAVTAKDKTKKIYYTAINYISNEKERSLIMQSGGDIHELKFMSKFKKALNLNPPEKETTALPPEL